MYFVLFTKSGEIKVISIYPQYSGLCNLKLTKQYSLITEYRMVDAETKKTLVGIPVLKTKVAK